MSDNNSSGGGCSCLSIIIFIVLICLCVSYCNRQDKSKGIIDNSIETVHGWWNHAKNVWDGHDPNPDLDFSNQKPDSIVLNKDSMPYYEGAVHYTPVKEDK